MSGLSLGTTICRADPADGRPIVHDVAVFFDVEAFTPGRAPTYSGPFAEPGWAAEYEFAFLGAAIEGAEADEPALTEGELAGLEAWFHASYDRAADEAEGRYEGGGR